MVFLRHVGPERFWIAVRFVVMTVGHMMCWMCLLLCLQSNNVNSQDHFLKLESLRGILGCIESSLLRFFWEPRGQRWRLETFVHGLVVFLLNTIVHLYVFFLRRLRFCPCRVSV